jgi:hypothetical protein
MIAALLLAAVAALVVAVAACLRTPDWDYPRAFPDAPEQWRGITGVPAPLRCGLGTVLFWSLATAAAAAFVALGLLLFPPQAAFLMGLLGGFLVAVAVARRMLRWGPGAMRMRPREPKRPVGQRPRVLFICGSPNQTTQMHQIARQLPEVEAWFASYYTDDWFYVLLFKLGLTESTIAGHRRRGVTFDYLNEHGLPIDLLGEHNEYDLYLSPNDQLVPPGMRGVPCILVQEGIQEPPNWRTRVWQYTRLMPRVLTGTATYGLSDQYVKFCLASEGYRRRYLAAGIAPQKLEVTGVPNFDNFAQWRNNTFPHRGYVLVCTSDARETLLSIDRMGMLRKAVQVAAGRQLIFKLHPNERVDRAIREIRLVAPPDALIFTDGPAEEMVANCDVLFTEWSSLTFCGMAFGKEIHSLHPLSEVKEMLPLQHGRAAQGIAEVVRKVLAERVGRRFVTQAKARKAS